MSKHVLTVLSPDGSLRLDAYARAYCPAFDLLDAAGEVRFEVRDVRRRLSASETVSLPEIDDFVLPRVRWGVAEVQVAGFDESAEHRVAVVTLGER